MRRLLALLITFTFVPAATAFAGGGAAVVRDCTDDGVLQGHYTQKQLRDALSSIPSDVDAQPNCRDVLRRGRPAARARRHRRAPPGRPARAAAGGGKGGAGAAGGSAGGEFGGFKAPQAG